MKKLTESEVSAELALRNVKLIEWGGTIRSISTFQPPCGHIIKMPLKTFRLNRGNCPRCAGRASYTLETAREALEGTGVTLKKWGGLGGRVSTFKCHIGHEWDTTLSLVLNGSRCPHCAGNVLISESDARDRVAAKGFKLITYSGSTQKHGSIFECSEGHQWAAKANYVIHGPGTGCPKCCKSGPSTGEDDLFNFVSNISPDAVQSYRKLIGPKEVDVYVPGKNVAIEFNGLYWHSEEFHDKKYHIGKRLAVEEKGCRLISIREDLWNERQPQVMRIVKNALGVSSDRIGARQTTITELSGTEVKNFMNENHVQGYKSATVHFALQHNDEPVAVLSLTYWRNKAQWEVTRYATSCTVSGGLSRLWKHAIKTLDIISAYTYIDRDLFTGDAYVAIGFQRIASTVGFRVVNRSTTESRQKWNRAPSGMTQSQWYAAEGVKRIYDSGQDKLIFKA